MEKLGLSVPFFAVLFGLATAAGCAAQSASGGNGGGGPAGSSDASSAATSSSSESSTSASSTSASGMGGAGGGMGGAGGGMGGAGGGMGGAGGAGGGFVQPVGSPDYPSETEQNNLKASANKLAAGTKGFTGAIYPAGDVDIYEVDVAVAGSALKVAITDGMGGCPPGVATYVRIFNDSNLLIASDTDAGPGLCSLLTPQANPNLTNMPVGKYFVQVESTANEIPFYIVDINLKPPGCGDGILQIAAGEQCDDSNTVSGDGCSSVCHLEGNYTTEVESNDTPAKANSLDGYVGVVAAINIIGDVDYFSFDINVPGSQVKLEVGDGLGGCPNGFDSYLYLYDSANNQLAADDDGGPGSCSLISPAGYPAAGNLGVGKYYVKVERNANLAAQPLYVLSINIKSPGCGDAILQPGEQCDDGNTVSGDGCSSTCKLESGNYISETEPNGSIPQANPLGAADGFVGGINPLGDADYFSFDVSVPGSSVIIQTGDGLGGCPANFDSLISLYDPMGTLITTDDNSGVPKCSLISPVFDVKARGLAMGNYTVRVEHANNNVVVPVYAISIRVAPPGCGDGVVVAGEQCDDANTKSGDGCSSACQVEPPFEIEPNNSLATATPLWPGTSLWKGSINPPGDHDYFTFTTAAVSAVTLGTHDADNPATCAFDTTMYLLDSNGTLIVKDDDAGPGSCSLINKTLYPVVGALPAGTYYVWIQKYLDGSPGIPLYQLDLKVQ